jgi:hypothetical protein
MRALVEDVLHSVIVAVDYGRRRMAAERILQAERGDTIDEVVVFFPGQSKAVVAPDRQCAAAQLPLETEPGASAGLIFLVAGGGLRACAPDRRRCR